MPSFTGAAEIGARLSAAWPLRPPQRSEGKLRLQLSPIRGLLARIAHEVQSFVRPRWAQQMKRDCTAISPRATKYTGPLAPSTGSDGCTND